MDCCVRREILVGQRVPESSLPAQPGRFRFCKVGLSRSSLTLRDDVDFWPQPLSVLIRGLDAVAQANDPSEPPPFDHL
jgi:hypothetical protein